MSVTWTTQQQQVIDARGCNLLVSAAAGSGKTAVLVERILSMLTDSRHPTDIDRLLIVTFTNAAAGEMKERIRTAIEKKLEAMQPKSGEEERLFEHLQRQMSLLSNAQITTIHSFCQHVIRNQFHTIDLDPGLRVADDGEQKLLQNDVMRRLTEECYAKNDENFRHMSECLAFGRDDEALCDTALALYQYSRSFPFPEEWLRSCGEAYLLTEKGLDEALWVQQLQELSTQILWEVKGQIEEAVAVAESLDGPYIYLDALLEDLQLADGLLAADGYSARSDAIRAIKWARLSAKKDERISEEKKQQVKDIRDSYKKTVGELQDEFYYAPSEEIAEQMQKSAPVLKSLIEFTCLFAGRYAQEKRKKNLMDFNDLEHFALKILVCEEDGQLRPSPVAKDYAAYYEEILIDEYQDSNLVQEMLLTSISRIADGSYNIFMVGDVKQSIYRFRLARPELFTEKYDSYSLEGGDRRRIDLHKNFRSRREVLESVNFLFEQLMEKRLGNVEYDDAAALYPGAEFAEGDDADFRNTEVCLLDTALPQTEETEGETARELEAHAVAGRIRKIVGSKKVWDASLGAYRPAAYGDIVILLRTMQGWAEVFAGVLNDCGIPAHTGSRTGYFSTTEVQTVLSLLRVIDNPRQDIFLTAVLHSPIGGLSGAELSAVRSSHPDIPFYEACMQEESLKDFFDMVKELRDMALYTPIHELLWQIYERTGYAAYAAAMPGGSQRKANLDMLVEKAIAYEKGSYRGLYNFVRYIENLQKYDVDFGEAAVGGPENAVRIISIHKSKGLEFPIVFVCGMGKQINQSDARAGLVIHADLGIGCDYVEPELRTRTATLLKRFIKRKTIHESLGEELRVLYVALTRAKEKLILTGTTAELPEKLQKWSRVCRRQETALPFTMRAQASSYWDWVMPALMRNRCIEELAGKYALPINRNHPLYRRESFFEIRELTAEDLVETEKERQKQVCYTKEQLLSLPADKVFDEETAKKLSENLSYCYPYMQQAHVPAKVSVSELKKMKQYEESEDGAAVYEEPVPVPLIPEFLKEESPISGAARGTIYHKLMECLDFAALADSAHPGRQDLEEFVEAELARLLSAGHLKEDEAGLIEKSKITAFLSGPLAARMADADAKGRLFRERQFVLEVPAGSMNAAWDTQETVLIQGIIDAYFIEENEIVLVDYKTDFVKLQEASSLYDKYAVQLDYYETALMRLTHLPVREKLIYSFCLNRVLRGEEDCPVRPSGGKL